MTRIVPTTHVEILQPFIDATVFGVSEIHTSHSVVESVIPDSATRHPLDYLSVAIAVWAPVHGHVCADISSITQQVQREMTTLDQDDIRELITALEWPDQNEWLTHLQKSPLVSSDTIDFTKPLVLSGSYLYLTRQFVDEEDVARGIGARLKAPRIPLHSDAESWINDVLVNDIDQKQSQAIRNVLSYPTSILLGGPGTGKTFTIAGMLHALFSEQAAHETGEPLRIALAAPTAKAAQQMTASITASLDAVDDRGTHTFPQQHRQSILRVCTTSSSTIHRLLGWTPASRGRFVHDKFNTLPYDIVVIDEVSMISLPLMARLLEALAPHTKLVLVGDPAQLQSVEAGAVLPQIASLAHRPEFPMVTLTRNHRQETRDSNDNLVLNNIGKLATEIRAAFTAEGDFDASRIIAHLENGGPEVVFIALDDENPQPITPSVQHAMKPYLHSYEVAATCAREGRAHEALAELAKVRVLCAHREGDYGVSRWNNIVAAVAHVEPTRGSVGQPLLNTRNDIRSGLVNGDISIVVQSGTSRVAVFPAVSLEGNNQAELRSFSPSTLDSVEVAFAMTVHKAQGSQFDTVVVILPPETSPLLQREMLYTAVTRAKSQLVIVGSRSAIRTAMNTSIQRASALAQRIVQQ